jgi:serine protease Do
MKPRFYLGLAIVLFIAGVLCVTIPIARAYQRPVPPPLAISTVMLSDIDGTGHGSGVHIGGGLVLTAAHVVTGADTMELSDSLKRKQKATVLWASKAYDVALVRIDDASAIAASPLNCHGALDIGAKVAALGNPLNLTFVRTWGRVGAGVEERGPWKRAFVADLTVAPGMSGGPVFNSQDEVIGLTVGITSLGAISPFPFTYIVPASAVCMLMGRAA